MDEQQVIIDRLGQEIKKGDKVTILPVIYSKRGYIIEITDYDVDLDDEGRPKIIYPKIAVRLPSGRVESFSTFSPDVWSGKYA